MSRKKDLDLLINRIKASTGLNQEQIANKISYSRAHFSTLKSNNSIELYNLLEAYFQDALESKLILQEAESNYEVANDGLNEERAMLQVIMAELAKIKSKLYGVTVDAAVDELQQNTRLALRQIKKAGGV